MTEQLEAVLFDATRVQLVPGELKTPEESEVKLTVPLGEDLVPALEAGSFTVAVQTDPWLTRTDAGTHVTEVTVGRRVIVSANDFELPEWEESPPYVAVTM